MTFHRRCFVGLIFLSIGVSPAFADNAAPPASVEAAAHVVKAKPKTKPKPAASVDSMSMQDIKFSDPSAPVAGTAKPPKQTVAPTAKYSPAEPQGGASLDLKWHAESHVNNPYWEPWVPNGEGQSVEAGVKVGF